MRQVLLFSGLAAVSALVSASCAGNSGAVDGAPSLDGAAGSDYTPVTIGFEDLAPNTILTTQYAEHATFSTVPTSQVTVWFYADFGTGHYVQTGLTEDNSGMPLYVDFAKPIQGLAFIVLGANTAGPCADLHVFQDGTQTASIPFVGQGDPRQNVPVDLSSYTHVTRLEVVNVTDFDSLAFDQFTFSFPQ